MKNQQGQVSIFFILIVPALVIVFLIVVDFAVLIDSKIKLQVALDRGLFAGAARLAYLMNRVAEENWLIRKSFLKVDKNAAVKSWQAGECQNRVNELKSTQKEALDNIDDLIETAYSSAFDVARNLTEINYKGSHYKPIYGKPEELLFGLIESGKNSGDGKNQLDPQDKKELIRKNIICGNIEGVVFDPNSVNVSENQNVLTYSMKSGEQVGLVSTLSALVKLPFIGDIFKPVAIEVIGAAQPYGGSIKRFAFLAGEWEDLSLEETMARAEEESQDGERAIWYRPLLVPVELFSEFVGLDLNNEDSNI
jgi:hypothetical protein